MATTLFSPSAPTDTTAREPSSRTQPDPLGLELRQSAHDRWVAILPNPVLGQAPFKPQYFTLSGLAGHQPYASPQAAYRAALRQGYTELDPGALERLRQTLAWQAADDTPAAGPPATALSRVLRALIRLEQEGATVETITLRPGRVPPLIVVSGSIPELAWRCYVWGHDRRGRYRRFTASLEGCQVVREVRDGPARSHPRW
jgi:hypothetical protein